MKRFLFSVVLIAIFLAGLYDWNHRRREARVAEPFNLATTSSLNLKDVQLLAAIDQEYTKLVEAVVPSVVSITTTKRVQTGYTIDPYEFFRNHRLRGIPQQKDRVALGSGFIVSKEGHILTNNHVVEDTDKIQVELSDGRAVPAQVIGADPYTDIAVLKIQADNLTPLPLGNSDQVKVGQLVFAIGNPLGLQESVTRGIISAKSRVVDDSSTQYFQTDAAINPGNSGGPLVNLRGEVIGINTRITSQTGGSQGLGFAIPSNVARRTLEAILKQGYVAHGYLGVAIQQLSPELAAQLGLSAVNGALVTQIVPDSPAQKAGLKSGDIITKFNGNPLRDVQDLRNRVAETPVNTKVDLSIVRANQESTVTAEITEQPADFRAAAKPAATPIAPHPAAPEPSVTPNGENVLAGVSVAAIPADRLNDLPENVKGVLVTTVDPNSVAAQSLSSLQPGDVIEEINHKPVTSVAEFHEIAGQLGSDGKQALLFICRGKTRSFIVLTPR